jgi:uncharacterized protein (TIGR03086 family)
VNEPQIFVLADRALERVVAQITADHWDLALPPRFMTRGAERPPTLREVVNYHAYDDAWVPDMLAGRTMEKAGADRFDGDLLGDHPTASFSRIVGEACAAAEGVIDLDATVHCSFGDYSVREYFWQINGFRALRAHDIARVIGVEASLPHELVRGVYDEIHPNIEEWRAIGVFPPPVPVPDGAPLLDRLLGMTGRQPGPS